MVQNEFYFILRSISFPLFSAILSFPSFTFFTLSLSLSFPHSHRHNIYLFYSLTFTYIPFTMKTTEQPSNAFEAFGLCVSLLHHLAMHTHRTLTYSTILIIIYFDLYSICGLFTITKVLTYNNIFARKLSLLLLLLLLVLLLHVYLGSLVWIRGGLFGR